MCPRARVAVIIRTWACAPCGSVSPAWPCVLARCVSESQEPTERVPDPRRHGACATCPQEVVRHGAERALPQRAEMRRERVARAKARAAAAQADVLAKETEGTLSVDAPPAKRARR